LRRRQPISEDVAHKIWDILVEHAGVRPPSEEEKINGWDIDRDSFVATASKGEWTEWRLGGSLGFGGKVWFNAGRWYVTSYREDETPERLETINRTNAALNQLWEETFGVPPNV